MILWSIYNTQLLKLMLRNAQCIDIILQSNYKWKLSPLRHVRNCSASACASPMSLYLQTTLTKYLRSLLYTHCARMLCRVLFVPLIVLQYLSEINANLCCASHTTLFRTVVNIDDRDAIAVVSFVISLLEKF